MDSNSLSIPRIWEFLLRTIENCSPMKIENSPEMKNWEVVINIPVNISLYNYQLICVKGGNGFGSDKVYSAGHLQVVRVQDKMMLTTIRYSGKDSADNSTV